MITGAIGGFLRRLAFVLPPLLLPAAGAPAGERITVFAASSMTDVLMEAADRYESRCGCTVVLSFAGSSILARQIEAGAPADLFLSADQDWMNALQNKGLIRAGSRIDIAANRLVIAVPANQASDVGPVALERVRFAMGDPSGVPAGRYAQAALQARGLWERVRANAVFTENVRVALAMAARGDVGAAIVYESDTRIEKRVAVGYRFEEGAHPAIRYPAALTANAGSAAAAFLDFLRSDDGLALFEAYGFAPANGG